MARMTLSSVDGAVLMGDRGEKMRSEAMPRPVWGVLIAVAMGAGMAAGMGCDSAAAQSRRDDGSAGTRQRPPARITVTPSRRLVRECEAWYATERRLAGTVVTPQMRCWWTYR